MGREANSAVNLLTKYILFFINFFLFVLAIVVIVLMTWILLEKEKEIKTAYDFFMDPAIILLLVGIITLLCSFFGWIGAFRETLLFLQIYQGCMTFWFFFQIVFVVLIFVVVYVPDARDKLDIYPEEALKTAIVKYRDDPDMQDLIDSIQLNLECCGTSGNDEGYKDWSNNEYFTCVDNANMTETFEFCSVPYSCCIQENNGLVNYACGKNMQSSESDATRATTIYTKGCLKAITDILNDNVLVVGGVLIAVFIPQMVLSWMSRTLCEQIKMQMAKWNRQPRPQR